MKVALKVDYITLVVNTGLNFMNIWIDLVVGELSVCKGEHHHDFGYTLLLEMFL